jgi:hypothetical protein
LRAESELEIEIVNPDMVTLDDGSMEITLSLMLTSQTYMPFDGNLAEVLMKGTARRTLSEDLLGLIDC